MAKRFTDSLKYKKHFFRNLPGAYKLFYDFLYHDCDHAGIWIVDIETAQIFVGKDMPINEEKALEYFNSDEIRIIPFDGGKKWFIPLFIKFQYGKLSEKNRAHCAVIDILKKFNLIDENLIPIEKISPFEKSPKPLWQKPKGDKDMDKEKEKDMEMDKDMDKAFGKSENLLIPQMLEVWIKTFPSYTCDKEFDYPALRVMADFIFKNAGIKKGSSYGNSDNEIKALNTFQLIADQVNRETFWVNKSLSTISKNIQEFYNKIKNPVNGTTSKGANGAKIDENILKQKLAQRADEWRKTSH